MGGLKSKDSDGRKDHGSVWRDAEYVAVLRDIEPAGTAEFAQEFGVSLEVARRRLEKLHNGDNPPVDRKKIGGAHVWFVDESGAETNATTAAEEVRRRMGVDEDQ